MTRPPTIWISAGLALAGWLLYRAHIGRVTRELTAQYGHGTPVWVAARDVLAGYELTEKDLRLTHVPAVFLQPGAITNTEWNGVGQVVRIPLRKGEQIQQTKLALEGGGRLSLRIGPEPDRRAITLKLDAEAALAGLIQPRDRVDIVGVFESASSSTETTRSHAMVLAQAVRVLAVDQRLSEGMEGPAEMGTEAGRSSGPGRQILVTLEVEAADAWRLALASQIAHLRCVLRHRTNDRPQPLVPPAERLPLLKGEDVFGARVPVKIGSSHAMPFAELPSF